MTTYDITRPLYEGMPVWPGDPAVVVEDLTSLQAGDAFRVSRLVMGSHTGTHVDAPAHALPGGGTVDALLLSVLWGPASLRAITGVRVLSEANLQGLRLPRTCRRLLLYTGGDSEQAGAWSIGAGYPALDASAARWLVARGVRLIGIDSLSIEPYGEDMGPVHRLLLSAGVVVVEGLALGGVPDGEYTLVCLPMKVRGGDGAPARALLRAD